MKVTHDKDQALDNAMRLFWMKGFASTSLKDLERATGMHPGSLYAAFGSKAELFCRSMERYGEWIDAAHSSASQDASGHLDALANFVERTHPVSSEKAPVRTCFMVKTALELGGEDTGIQRRMLQLLDVYDRTFEEAFRSALAAGELPKNSEPAKLARRLSSSLAGVCFFAMRSESSEAITELVSELAEKVRSGTI